MSIFMNSHISTYVFFILPFFPFELDVGTLNAVTFYPTGLVRSLKSLKAFFLLTDTIMTTSSILCCEISNNTSTSCSLYLYLFYQFRRTSSRGTASTSVEIGTEASRFNSNPINEPVVISAPLSDTKSVP